MEFKSFKNIESSFRQIRLFTLVFLGICASLTTYALWKSYLFANQQREKVYVLDQGKSLIVALSQDAALNRPVAVSYTHLDVYKRQGSVACRKSHKSVSYQTATEWRDEKIDMRIKSELIER